MTDADIRKQFQYDMGWASAEASACVKTFAQQPPCIQTVMTDMVFNLGGPRLCGWSEVVNNIDKGDYESAYNAMHNSQWCDIVQTRCWRNADIVRNCRA